MTEMVTSGSMSGRGKRSDGLLGERDYERRRVLSAPPALYAAAPLFDSTGSSWPTNRSTGDHAALRTIDLNAARGAPPA